MRKIPRVVKVVAGVGVVLVVGFLAVISPFVFWAERNVRQQRALLSRGDHAQIAAEAVRLARVAGTGDAMVRTNDVRVPGLLRELGVRYFTVSTNEVRMEFHGGFDHYGYVVRQSPTNSARWTIFWYTEDGQRELARIEAE